MRNLHHKQRRSRPFLLYETINNAKIYLFIQTISDEWTAGEQLDVNFLHQQELPRKTIHLLTVIWGKNISNTFTIALILERYLWFLILIIYISHYLFLILSFQKFYLFEHRSEMVYCKLTASWLILMMNCNSLAD